MSKGPQPAYPSIERLIAEGSNAGGGLDTGQAEWWDGYTDHVLDVLRAKDKARENAEIRQQQAQSWCGYGVSMRIEDSE